MSQRTHWILQREKKGKEINFWETNKDRQSQRQFFWTPQLNIICLLVLPPVHSKPHSVKRTTLEKQRQSKIMAIIAGVWLEILWRNLWRTKTRSCFRDDFRLHFHWKSRQGKALYHRLVNLSGQVSLVGQPRPSAAWWAMKMSGGSGEGGRKEGGKELHSCELNATLR